MLDLIDSLTKAKEKVEKISENFGEVAEKKKTTSGKTWAMIIIDSLIVAVLAMAAVMTDAIPDTEALWTMFKAFLFAFVFQLAIERGLKKIR